VTSLPNASRGSMLQTDPKKLGAVQREQKVDPWIAPIFTVRATRSWPYARGRACMHLWKKDGRPCIKQPRQQVRAYSFSGLIECSQRHLKDKKEIKSGIVAYSATKGHDWVLDMGKMILLIIEAGQSSLVTGLGLSRQWPQTPLVLRVIEKEWLGGTD